MFRFMKTFALCWVMPMGRGHSIHQKCEVVLGPTSSWAPMPHLRALPYTIRGIGIYDIKVTRMETPKTSSPLSNHDSHAKNSQVKLDDC
jgi:hypothetical protein